MASFLKGLRRSSSDASGSENKSQHGSLQTGEDDADELLEDSSFMMQSSEERGRARTWSAANKNNLAKLDYPFSSEQMEAIAKVRANCAKELAESSGYEEVVSDRRILRFIRGHKFDLEVASEMYRKMLLWRKSSGVDKIRARIVNENLKPEDFPHAGRILRYYPGKIHMCNDKEGRPVTVELIGRIQPRKLLSCFSEEEWITHHIYCCEYNAIYLDKLTIELGSLGRMLLLYDLAGCSTSHLRSKNGWALIKRTLQVTQDNYPETMHKTFLVNVPKVFTMAWALLKPCLAERTVAKIEILGKDRSKLFEMVEKSQLPQSLGGGMADAWPLVFDKDHFKEIDEDYKVVEIAKGRKQDISVQVPKDSSLVWGFYSKSGDIDASISVKTTQVQLEQALEEEVKQDDNNTDGRVTVIHEIKRSEGSGGSMHVDESSIFCITFDNSFSWINKKVVHYYVCISSKQKKHQIDSPRNGRLKAFFA